MRRLTAVAPAVLIAAAGCLASKSDIRLLQDELIATRAQLASGDTAQLRQQENRRGEIAAISNKLDRMLDSLRSTASRLATFQATANGNFDALNQQMVQVQTLLGQTTRNLQEQRARIEALAEQGAAGATPPAPAGTVGSDSVRRGPGPATLFQSADEALKSNAYTTARRGFEQLVNAYPDDQLAPRAMLRIADSYKAEGNTAAADSVNQVVFTRYPTKPEAATGLYRHGKMLWDANKKGEARPYLNRVVSEFPRSDEAFLVRDLLRTRDQ
jgi:TolA-binding protein